MDLKYCVVGAGGTGGSIAAYMGRTGFDVTLMARGNHLEKLKEKYMLQIRDKTEEIKGVSVKSAEELKAENYKADVIFYCTKLYSAMDLVDFIEGICHGDTLIIPVLNGRDVTGRLRELMPNLKICRGCMYIMAEKRADGHIYMNGDLIRIVYGDDGKVADNASAQKKIDEILDKVDRDLKESGIESILSNNIVSDIFSKFAVVSSMSALGLYFDKPMGYGHEGNPGREFFKSIVRELKALGEATGINVRDDLVDYVVSVLDNVLPDGTTSLQRDVAAGGKTEFYEQITEPMLKGEELGIEMKSFRAVYDKYPQFHISDVK